MPKHLVLCDTEKSFAKKMYEYLHSLYSRDYEILLFTDSESLKAFLEQKRADILLLCEELKNLELKEKRIGHKIILSSQSNMVNEGCEVYKYKPMDRLFKDVLNMCAETIPQNSKEKDRSEKKSSTVIGIYTPIKRSSQTTFSLSLGQLISSKSKTLYLNFEGFSGFDRILGESNDAGDIMDLIYFSECSPAGFSFRAEAMAERIGNLEYIRPAKAFMKYSEISSEQWLRLINNLKEKTGYDVLILDLSEQVNGLFEVLRCCDIIFTITDDEQIAIAKMSQYKELLLQNNYSDVWEKTTCLNLNSFAKVSWEYEQLTHSKLADYIKDLLETKYKEYDWI